MDSLTLNRMKRSFDPAALDVRRFAPQGAQLEGTLPLAALPRLPAEPEGARGQAHPGFTWQAVGQEQRDASGRASVWLDLQVRGGLYLTCQRCLTPTLHPMEVVRRFRFVPEGDPLIDQELELEEDVLELDSAFNLIELVEDELLLDLPMVPMHDRCPAPLPVPAVLDEPAPATRRPFEVLRQLKRPDAPT